MPSEQKRRGLIFALRDRGIWPSAVFTGAYSSERAIVLVAALITALALLLRLHGLGDKPFWYDEFLTRNRANLPFAQLVLDAFKHKHYPTYFILVRPFASAENIEWALRLPSALFGALSVFVVARVAGEIRGLVAALVAALLMAFSPLEVQFGQEARPYALISLLVLIAIWGLLRIAQHPVSAARPLLHADGLRGPWAAYLLGTVGALLIENNTLPWLVISNVIFAIILHRAPAADRRPLLRNWACIEAIIVLLWLPGFLFMYWLNRGTIMTAISWVPKLNWDNVRSFIAALYLFRISDLMTFALAPARLPAFGAAIALLALFGAWRLKSRPTLLAVIGLAFVAMPITLFVISTFKPVLVPRYMLWSTGPFFALAGIGAASLPARIAPTVALLVAVGAGISLMPYYQTETKPRWDQAATFLAANVRPQDVIVVQGLSDKFVLVSYIKRLHLDSKLPIVPWNRHDKTAVAAQGKRAWVVYGVYGQGSDETEQEFLTKWSGLGPPAQFVRFGSHILILRFDAPALEPP